MMKSVCLKEKMKEYYELLYVVDNKSAGVTHMLQMVERNMLENADI